MSNQLTCQNLDEHVAKSINEQINRLVDPTPPQKWQAVCQVARHENIDPSHLRKLWNQIFPNASLNEQPIWWPDDTTLRNANLTRWMRKRGFTCYDELHHWSIEHRDEFWKQAIAELDIVFDNLPRQILDDSSGAEFARWLPGATLNIAANCFRADPDAHAVVHQQPGRPLQYQTLGQLKCLANRVANGLVMAGLHRGNAIAVVLPMTADSVAIYLGMILAGATVVSIADSFAAPEIANRLRIAGAQAVFTYDEIHRGGKSIPLYARVTQATELPVIALPQGDQLVVELRPQDTDWQDFLSGNESFEPVMADANESINILFSSGTTGDPKAIPWNHLTPIKCATDGLLHQDIQPGSVVAWPTNLGWMMGPWLIFAALLNRATIALFEDAPIGEEFGRFVQNADVNMLGVVPTLVRSWRKTKCMEPFDWSHISCFSSTGEASGAEDMFYLSALAGMKPIIEYCGGTEIGGGYVTSTVVQPNVAAAFSTPAAGLDLVILGEGGQTANDGELFLIPPSIGLSQHLLNRDHHETYFAGAPSGPHGETLRRHGDHMRRLNNGYYAAGGRVDDTMNLGGIKVSSAEIEQLLNLISGVKETAAVAFSDGAGPEQLAIFAVCDRPMEIEWLQTEMNERIKSQLNPLFKIRRAIIVDQLPRTASGKVMRRKLRSELDA